MNRLDPKQISFFTTVGLWKKFKAKCASLGLSCKEVLIALVSKWIDGKIKIPQEGK